MIEVKVAVLKKDFTWEPVIVDVESGSADLGRWLSSTAESMVREKVWGKEWPLESDICGFHAYESFGQACEFMKWEKI